MDIFSRDMVGWEIWEEESAEHASHLIRKAVMAQGLSDRAPMALALRAGGFSGLPCFAPEKGFVSIEAAREWMLSLARWYRHVHRHSSIRCLTPHQLHMGDAQAILENRRKVYADTRAKNPLRWRKHTRPWILSPEVWLNKPKSFDDDLRQLS